MVMVAILSGALTPSRFTPTLQRAGSRRRDRGRGTWQRDSSYGDAAANAAVNAVSNSAKLNGSRSSWQQGCSPCSRGNRRRSASVVHRMTGR